MMCGVQTCSAVDVARELDIHWVVHRIVWDQLDYREVCTHWVLKNPTCVGRAHCMGLSCIYWTCYTDKREQYWSLNMVNCTKPEKGCAIEKLLSPSSKENGSIVISKDDCGKLSWDHKHVLVLDFLDHGDTVCLLLLWYTYLMAAFLAKGPSYFASVLSFCMKTPGIIHPTGQLFMAVHRIGCGSGPIMVSVFSLSLNP